MKTLKNISLFLAIVATLGLASCSNDTTFTPGPNEVGNSYGIFFPTQTTTFELDPAAPTTLTFTVMRNNDQGAVTPPIVVTSSVENIFSLTPISFDDGQTETSFEVSFSDAEIGKTYKIEVLIDDPQYALIYGDKPTGLNIEITRIKWNQLKGPNGETTGKWRDGVISDIYGIPNKFAETDIEIYERDDMRGYYRIANVYSAAFLGLLLNDAPEDWEENRKDVYTFINATNPARVWIPRQEIGVILNSSEGWISMASRVTEAGFSGTYYGVNTNGIITFPADGVLWNLPGYSASWYVGGYNNFRIMLPGVVDYDFSLQLEASEPSNGIVDIDVTFGADVASVKYAFFPGALSASTAATRSGDMNSGAVETEEITSDSTLNVSFEETGIYTIVANIYNAAGELKGFKFISFGYIADGDEKPVIMSVGLNITNQFANDGYTTEDAVQFWASGKGIVSGSYALYESDALEGATEDDIKADVLKNGKAFTADDIAKITGVGGFSTMIGSLNGGTKHTIAVVANNGFISQLFVANATTEGTPHPLKRFGYTVYDLSTITKADLFKTWNMWALNTRSGAATKRTLLGEVTFSENTAKDEEGLDAINVKGLSLGRTADDTIAWEYYNGVIYTLQGGAYNPMGTSSSYYVGIYYSDPATGLGSDEIDFMMIGGALEDSNYIALVCNTHAYGDYNFTRISIMAYSDAALTSALGYLERYQEIVFENPAVSTAASMRNVSRAQLHTISKEMNSEITNFVELRGRERIRAMIDETVGKPKLVNRSANTMVVDMPATDAVKANVTVSKSIKKVSAATSGKFELKAKNLQKAD